MIGDGGFFGIGVMLFGFIAILAGGAAAIKPGERARGVAMCLVFGTILMGLLGTGVGMYEASAVTHSVGVLAQVLGSALVPTTLAAGLCLPAVALLGISRARQRVPARI